MSPSIDESTFSKTSVARGNCKFIDFWQTRICSEKARMPKATLFELPTELVSKEHLLYKLRGMHEYEGFSFSLSLSLSLALSLSLSLSLSSHIYSMT
jgi:hypothetical protein